MLYNMYSHTVCETESDSVILARWYRHKIKFDVNGNV